MNKMEEITNKMAEHICGSLCRYNTAAEMDQDQLDEICAECEMGEYICSVLNEYARAADREKPGGAAVWSGSMMDRFMQVN